MINKGFCCCWWVVAMLAACAGEPITWPQTATSVRIDTKVRFLDEADSDQSHILQADEMPFVPALETSGFYNRPPDSGRFPVRVETHQGVYTQGNNQGPEGSVQYCKCVSNPDCQYRQNSKHTCGVGKYLCCYKRSPRLNQQNTEFFNEIDDERPATMLFPSRENIAKPFPDPDTTGLDEDHPSVLVGPGVPGRAGPAVIGQIGQRGVLVGPGGPTGIIGPNDQHHVLVGPSGPTGLIGPRNPNGPRDINPDETAQRGVLVGPGGPTGIIGPSFKRPILVGPGGPTGVIGPRGYFNDGRQGFGRRPGAGVLVGPGGPTGNIGPQRYYGK